VTARNARGSGPAATTTLQYDGPNPPPAPAGGQQLVASDTSNGPTIDGMGTTTLNLSVPADWASFGGTCTWTHTGNQSGADSGSFPCNAAAVQIPINNGYIQDPNPGTVSHSVVFHATNGAAASDSAPYTWTTTQPTGCSGCPPP
jgi:hypothetical protein